MADVIKIKPHHFVDIIAAYGTSKIPAAAHPYGHSLHTVTAKILDDIDIILEIVLDADDICAPCRHNIDGFCDDVIDTSFRPTAPSSKGKYNLLIDTRWCERLGFKPGSQLTARQFCEKLSVSADNIVDIYREVPAERVMQKAARLKTGINKFLVKNK